MSIKKASFTEAEDIDVEYYASINWKESAINVEEMRRMIWSKEYNSDPSRTISIAALKDDRDDFE
ncbi:MAG: hypothetical protein ABIS01_02720 [Ferruginibacter sp.]